MSSEKEERNLKMNHRVGNLAREPIEVRVDVSS